MLIAPHYFMYSLKLGYRLCKPVRRQRLRPVALCMLWIVVDFYEDAVGAGGDACICKCRYPLISAAGVGRIYDDGQMRHLAKDRHARDVECVSGIGLECPARTYSALMSHSS